MVAACGRIAFDAGSDAAATGDDGATGTDTTVADDASLPADLALWMRFDTIGQLDAVASELGTCSPSCPMLTVAGRVGSGGVFSGTSCVRFANRPSFNSGELTVALFVRGPLAGDLTLATKPYDTTAPTANSWELTRTNGQIGFPSFSSQFDPWTTPALVMANTWHHVAITYGSGTKRVYLDGVMQGMTLASAFSYNDEPLQIGCDINNSVLDGYITGTLDEIRIYTRELMASEIAALAAM